MEKRFTYPDLLAGFGERTSPREVTQTQFDGNQEALERLARSTEKTVRVDDLFDYALDLQYEKLQPDLLKFVFPLCLKVWAENLVDGTDSLVSFVQQFHASLAGRADWQAWFDDPARAAVRRFMRDTVLGAIERQRGLRFRGYTENDTPEPPAEKFIDPILSAQVGGQTLTPYRWAGYLASFGTISEEIPSLWQEWWSFHTPGAAIAAFQYVSCLIYPEEENPVFRRTVNRGGGPPRLWSYESLGVQERWLPENIDFLRRTLDVDYLKSKLEKAAARLIDEPEEDQARSILEDFGGRTSTALERIEVLLDRLEIPGSEPLGW